MPPEKILEQIIRWRADKTAMEQTEGQRTYHRAVSIQKLEAKIKGALALIRPKLAVVDGEIQS